MQLVKRGAIFRCVLPSCFLLLCVGLWLPALGCGSGSTPAATNPQADFNISVSPAVITANAGSSSSKFTVSITGKQGFVGSVAVAISGLPAGATTVPAFPLSVSAGTTQTVILSVPSSTGNFPLTVTGKAGSVLHSASLTLTINPAPDFSISVSPSTITAAPGGAANFIVSSSGTNGFTGPVTIAISGLPAGATTFPASPFSIPAGSSQNVSLPIPSSAPTGNYTVVMNGTSGALAHSATLALTVSLAPDFSIGLSPSAVAANAGTFNTTFSVAITGQNGFTNPVTVTLSGLPNGTTTTPASPFDVAPGNNQTVTLSVPANAVSGVSSVTVGGSSGSLTHSTPLTLTIVGQVLITTWHYDNARTGANVGETTLTPANVNSTTFGKIATFPVDGFVVGHPLYLPGVNILGQMHNVVYVATMHDSVYAFDADSTNPTPLWMTSILNYSPLGATSVPSSVTKNAGTTGWSEVGIVSTPVIDPNAGMLYLVAETYENGNVVHRLHALDVTTGLEIPGGPATIAASYTLNGTTTTFKDLYQLNRPGLLLANGHIYIGFGSNCCNNYSQGWLLSYNASTLQQEGAYTAEPGKTLASIWQKGAGISADNGGNIYAETAEGFYNPGTNLSTSVLKLSQNGTTLALTDWFTPYNYLYLSQNDLDLANGVLILPDQPGAYTHEAIAIGKEGTVYVLNRDNLGQLCTNCTTGDTQIVQEISHGVAPESNMPAYWNNLVYFTGVSAPVVAYTLSNGTLVVPPSAESTLFPNAGHVMITANGNSNGILWLINSLIRLVALDAITLNTLYTSDQAAGQRDTLPPVAHFAVPIAAEGKVFVGTQNSVVVYGLLSHAASLKTQGGSLALRQDQPFDITKAD
jgi:hypothetical protein